MKRDIQASGHIKPFIVPSDLINCVRLAVKALKHHNYDALAFRGMSGALIAAPLCVRTKKPMVMVRKPNDVYGHSSYRVEGPTNIKNYIIVDDFVSSGKTANAIIETLNTFAQGSNCLGVLEVQRLHRYKQQIQSCFKNGVPFKLTNDRNEWLFEKKDKYKERANVKNKER